MSLALQKRGSTQIDSQAAYHDLLREFTTYREQSILEKEQMKKQIEKCRQQLEKFISKLDKRVESRINEEKLVNNHHMDEQEGYYKEEIEKLRAMLTQKDRMIDEMRNMLRLVESEKRQMIENNTKMLVELNQGLEFSRGEKAADQKDNSYKELLKMYQFLIEENNELKKQIYLAKRNTLNQSLAAPKDKEEKSLASFSEHKQKSPTLHSTKNQNTNLNKSGISKREEANPKPKKVPKPKNNNK